MQNEKASEEKRTHQQCNLCIHVENEHRELNVDYFKIFVWFLFSHSIIFNWMRALSSFFCIHTHESRNCI